MIAQYLDGGPQNTWDQLLPEISLAINSSVSDTTGFSPAFLTQGREPRPRTLYDELTPGRGTPEVAPTERSQQLKDIFRDNAERATADQGRHYNLRRRTWKPPVGSLVLVRRHAFSNAAEGFAAKLAARYEGPFRVAKFPSPNIVQLHVPGSRRRRTASLGQLKPYRQGEADDHAEGAIDDSDYEEDHAEDTHSPKQSDATDTSPGENRPAAATKPRPDRKMAMIRGATC
ncbi:hypothetical protein KR059_006080 [Drosophila kikkawai]|nr:hypothetical protein KR059_006080 [Drosophila kikkawai]